MGWVALYAVRLQCVCVVEGGRERAAKESEGQLRTK